MENFIVDIHPRPFSVDGIMEMDIKSVHWYIKLFRNMDGII
jgi:hypothetical protein